MYHKRSHFVLTLLFHFFIVKKKKKERTIILSSKNWLIVIQHRGRNILLRISSGSYLEEGKCPPDQLHQRHMPLYAPCLDTPLCTWKNIKSTSSGCLIILGVTAMKKCKTVQEKEHVLDLNIFKTFTHSRVRITNLLEPRFKKHSFR